MNSISLNGENISFDCPSKRMFVLDSLYIKDILDKKFILQNTKFSLSEVEKTIFEWSDGTLLAEYSIIKNNQDRLDIFVAQIKKLEKNQENIEPNKVFSTDSGLICLVDADSLLLFIENFKFDVFVDCLNLSSLASLYAYIQRLQSIIGNTFAIISTPGTEKGFDFDGSGTYYIDFNSTYIVI